MPTVKGVYMLPPKDFSKAEKYFKSDILLNEFIDCVRKIYEGFDFKCRYKRVLYYIERNRDRLLFLINAKKFSFMGKKKTNDLPSADELLGNIDKKDTSNVDLHIENVSKVSSVNIVEKSKLFMESKREVQNMISGKCIIGTSKNDCISFDLPSTYFKDNFGMSYESLLMNCGRKNQRCYIDEGLLEYDALNIGNQWDSNKHFRASVVKFLDIYQERKYNENKGILKQLSYELAGVSLEFDEHGNFK